MKSLPISLDGESYTVDYGRADTGEDMVSITHYPKGGYAVPVRIGTLTRTAVKVLTVLMTLGAPESEEGTAEIEPAPSNGGPK